MSTINFQDAHRKLHESDRAFEPQRKAINERDQAHWEAVGRSGSTVLSSVSEEAQRALDELERRRDAARARIAQPVIKACRVEIQALKAETAVAARDYLEKHRRLANLESQSNGFLASAGQPPQPRVTGQHTENPREFLDRVERVETASAPRPVLQPLERPRFEDLVNGPTIAIIAAASSPIEH